MATIVLVVANSASLTSGDTTVRDRLQNTHGNTIVLRSDDDAEYTGAYDGVFIAESVSSGTVLAKYSTVAKPAIVCESAVWDDWGMSSAGGAQAAGTQWDINATGHALVAGLTGTVTILSSSATISSVATSGVGAGAVIAALRTDDTTRTPYWAYETGAAMSTGNAAARRVAFGLVDAGYPNLTANGLALLDAAIDWAYPSSPPGPRLSRWHRTLLAR